MEPTSQRFAQWVKVAYDKIVLCSILFLLLLSVILLGFYVDLEKRSLASATWERSRKPPSNTQPVDLSLLSTRIEGLIDPFQIEEWTHRLMVAELRVSCVKCARPIPYFAEKCPYKNCNADQPSLKPNADKDSDMDGMPDEWEKKYGLNPNLDDANRDMDDDGFTNLEEYDSGTNPADPNDFPPPVVKLKIVKTARIPLALTFQAIASRKDGVYCVKNRMTGRDYYVKTNDMVEGYKVLSFEEKKVDVIRNNIPLKEDASLLRLSKENKEIVLKLNRDDGAGEWAAKVIYTADPNFKPWVVKIGDTITLKNCAYKVVDIKKDNVIVLDEKTGKQLTIGVSVGLPIGN